MKKFFYLLVLAAFSFFLSGFRQGQETAPAEQTNQDEQALIELSQEVLEQVAQLRGLEVKKDVRQKVMSRPQIRQFLIDKLEKEYPDPKLRADEKVFLRLGLLSAEDDLKALMLDLLTDQIAGFYDPLTETFTIADWIPDSMQRPVMAHELLHVLQDQHFDLDGFLREVEEDDDQFLARQALVEGEGIAIMFDFVLKPMGQEFQNIPQLHRQISRMQDFAPQSAAMAKTPAFLKDLLIFPYSYGAIFVRDFRLRSPWEDLAELYRDPPRSSEQIIHSEKYFGERDDPTPVEPSQQPPPQLEGTWQRTHQGVFGEYMLSRLLAASLEDETARKAAEGWDGDRFEWLEASDGRQALWLRTVWDSQDDAREFYRALLEASRQRLQIESRLPDSEDAHITLEAEGRRLSLHLEGLSVSLIDYDAR
ncbi:MAG TPA: hypothetical protein VLU25_08905 [Acidobacteriota bacterium]|nr:hypothetical protein [Acidobacteriota bacterium]